MGDIAITREREAIVHFSKNFMMDDIVTLVKKTTETKDVTDLEQLQRQDPSIVVGTVEGSNVHHFLKTSRFYKEIWQKISADPTSFVKTQQEGIDRVKKGAQTFLLCFILFNLLFHFSGGYAFITVQSTYDLAQNKDCMLKELEGVDHSFQYGFAHRKEPTGSARARIFNEHIHRIEEDNKFTSWYKKWFKRCECTSGGKLKCRKVFENSFANTKTASVFFTILTIVIGITLISL